MHTLQKRYRIYLPLLPLLGLSYSSGTNRSYPSFGATQTIDPRCPFRVVLRTIDISNNDTILRYKVFA